MTLGFIGCGNMASAIISGILEKEIVKKEDAMMIKGSRSMKTDEIVKVFLKN